MPRTKFEKGIEVPDLTDRDGEICGYNQDEVTALMKRFKSDLRKLPNCDISAVAAMLMKDYTKLEAILAVTVYSVSNDVRKQRPMSISDVLDQLSKL